MSFNKSIVALVFTLIVGLLPQLGFAQASAPEATPAAAADAVIRLYRSRSLAKVYPKRGTIARAVRLAARLDRRGAALFDVILAQTLLDNGVRRIVTEDVADFKDVAGLRVHTIADAANSVF